MDNEKWALKMTIRNIYPKSTKIQIHILFSIPNFTKVNSIQNFPKIFSQRDLIVLSILKLSINGGMKPVI